MTDLEPLRIDQALSAASPAISFEFFPPKTEEGFTSLYRTIEDLRPLHPTYVSVTYGAGGSTRQKTVDLVCRIQNELKLRAMAHLTCVGHSQTEIAGILEQLWNGGIRNILALRGDPQQGQMFFTPAEGGFTYANELVNFAAKSHPWCLGVAGYPEGHPQCLNRTRDLEHLRRKLDAGANFVITQLFFDNADFYRFRDNARAMGIKAPIVAGIMPILNVSQIKRFVSMCGTKIPNHFLVQLERVENDPAATYRLGIDHAVRQCRDLMTYGVDGLHFYTLNKSKATVDIVRTLQADHA